MSHVPVPPADTISPPTSSCALASSAIDSRTLAFFSSRSVTIMRWPSYPITPRTSMPRTRAESASTPACDGSQPQRGSPTFTSITMLRIPARSAASSVSRESTATVTRACSTAASAASRPESSVSFASR